MSHTETAFLSLAESRIFPGFDISVSFVLIKKNALSRVGEYTPLTGRLFISTGFEFQT